MARRTAEASTEYKSTHRYARVTARKARRVVDLIRGVPVEKALEDLKYCLRRAAPMVTKVLNSAINNATQVAGLDAGRLFVSTAVVNEGPTFKRWRPRAMGRAYPRMKRTCHIVVSVAELNVAEMTKKSRTVREEAAEARPPKAVEAAAPPAKETVDSDTGIGTQTEPGATGDEATKKND